MHAGRLPVVTSNVWRWDGSKHACCTRPYRLLQHLKYITLKAVNNPGIATSTDIVKRKEGQERAD